MEKYNCPTCGAELFWNSKKKALECKHCEAIYSPDDFYVNQSEFDSNLYVSTETATKNDVATDDSEENSKLIIYKCPECNAEIITNKDTVATTCAYCGRALSITEKMQGKFNPDEIIPFMIDKEKAKKIFKKYSHSTFLTPKKFYKENELKKIKGVYVPFWLHSFTDDAKITVYGEKTENTRQGDDKVIVHHKYNTFIQLEGDFDKVPTDGLKKLDNDLMGAIEPFDYSELTDFDPVYMAGFYAQRYNESSKKTFPEAVIKDKALNEVGFYESKRISSFSNNVDEIEHSYSMLPVWLLTVEYKKKRYLYAINGQTGKIAGKLPVSVPKIFLTFLFSFIIFQIVAMIIRIFT